MSYHWSPPPDENCPHGVPGGCMECHVAAFRRRQRRIDEAATNAALLRDTIVVLGLLAAAAYCIYSFVGQQGAL